MIYYTSVLITKIYQLLFNTQQGGCNASEFLNSFLQLLKISVYFRKVYSFRHKVNTLIYIKLVISMDTNS